MKESLAAVLLLLASEQVASAYADPGSGALLWQILVAGFVGLLYQVRRFLTRIRSRPRDTKV
jgi:hypothetical protein